jgi:dipeptidyl aminopeptidase/acylaminoacyl peptidase
MPWPLTIDEVVSFPYSGVGECDLSPDGRWVAYTYQGTIYIFDLETWRQVESFDGSHPKWSPVNPDVLVFLKSGHSGIFLRRMDGTEQQVGANVGEVRTLHGILNPTTFEWSCDGRLLAIVVERDLEEKDEGKNENADDVIIVCPPLPMYTSVLVVLDVVTGDITFEAESEVGETYEHLAWHPSGHWLTVLSTKRGLTGWYLFDLDLCTGKRTSRLGPGINEIGMMKWSPDGTKLALGYSPYNYLGDVRRLCAVMEVDSPQVRIVNNDYFVHAIYWESDSLTLYCDGLKGISRHVFRVDTVSERSEVIVDRTGWTSLKGVSRDRRTLLTLFRGLNSLSDVFVISVGKGQSRSVTHFSDHLAEYALSNAEVVEWSSYDGLVLQGVMVPPLGKAMSPEHPDHRGFARRTG